MVGNLSPSPVRLGKKDWPNLKIETESKSTGNEGLDAEKKWRSTHSNCEHVWGLYVSDENDNSPTKRVDCDFSYDHSEDAGKSTREKETMPSKHPAVEGERDAAFLCNNCHAVACKNCIEDYPSDESTPVSVIGFPISERDNSPTVDDKENASNSKSLPVVDDKSLSTVDNKSLPAVDDKSLSVVDNKSLPAVEEKSLPVVDDKENAGNSKSSSTVDNTKVEKPSILDDFADLSSELPDYTGGDD